MFVLVATEVVGRKAPVESKTTCWFAPGFKTSTFLAPVPVPEPETFISNPEYPPPPKVLSVTAITCPLLSWPLPALAVRLLPIKVPLVMAVSVTEKIVPVGVVEVIEEVPLFCS